jgi:hypothetical protein
MTKLMLLAASLALVACGDNHAKPDAFVHIDAHPVDALNIPSPPTPGAQIDRMGRPAINTALNHTFDVNTTTKNAAKDAYNQDAAAGTWPTTYVAEFGKNLALLDFLDSGLSCTNGACVGSANHNGCGNQALYNGNAAGGGSATATSYATLATVLGDDELYLDTSKSTCGLYLAVEFGSPAVTGLGNTTCGGRAPSYDVIDFSYTAMAIGLGGFTTTFVPAFGDNVGAHTDIDEATFPFLGAPHNQ